MVENIYENGHGRIELIKPIKTDFLHNEHTTDDASTSTYLLTSKKSRFLYLSKYVQEEKERRVRGKKWLAHFYIPLPKLVGLAGSQKKIIANSILGPYGYTHQLMVDTNCKPF